MVKLDGYKQQIVLAIKGWHSRYGSDDYTIHDNIKRILSYQFKIKYELVEDKFVYKILLNILDEADKWLKDSLLNTMFRHKEEVTRKDMIDFMISLIKELKVSSNGETKIELKLDRELLETEGY